MKIYIPFFVGMIFLFSCTKEFLKEKPTSFLSPENSFETQQSARLALDGVYESLQDRGWQQGPYSFLLMEQIATDITKSFASSTNNGLGDYSFTASCPEIYSYWTILYETVNRANLFLDNIDKVQMSDTLKNKYKGEAMFLRSLMYFNLVRLFGDVPMPLTSATTLDPAVTQLPRTAASQVYEQIISDLLFAETNLPDKGVAVNGEAFKLGQATKAAAQANLAKVYLHMGSLQKRSGGNGTEYFRKSIEFANKVINSNRYSLEPYFPDVWRKKDAGNNEVIFAVQYKSGAGTPPNAEGSMIGLYLGVKGSVPNGGAYSQPMVALYGTTYFLAGDTVRRRWTTVHGTGLTQVGGVWTVVETTNNLHQSWGHGKWRQFPLRETYTGTGDYGNHVPVLRLGELYLLIAEAENEVNNGANATAINAVNLLRRRACNNNIGGVHADITPRVLTNNPLQVPDLPASMSYQALKDTLFYERAREMGDEWSRYFDLQRWGQLVSAIKRVGTYMNPLTKRVEPEYNAAVNVSDKHYLLPIPSAEINANPKLTQNPGYN